MFRLYDFECIECGTLNEHLVEVPHGSTVELGQILFCSLCGKYTLHSWRLSIPAKYLGECWCAPQIRGGAYDTMGEKEHIPTPDLPGQAEYQEKLAERLRGVREHASSQEFKSAWAEATRDAPSSSDYATLFSTPEYKEAVRVNNQITEENEGKKKRAAAIRRGENVNFKKDKCFGDPKL
jgi:hypothetical protein